MAKKPTFTFEPDSFRRDVAHLPLSARGAWITILCLLHHAEVRGTLTLSRTEWATALGCPVNEAVTVLKLLLSKRICNGEWKSDDIVTLVSRRMSREYHSSLLLQERVLRHREKKRGESEGEWWEKQRQIYDHVDLDFESKKMDAWLELPENILRMKTRRFILNWLNRIPRPVKGATSNGTLTAAVAWSEVEEMRQGKRKVYSHPAIARTTKAIGGIFASDITTTSLDVKRGQFLKMFPDIATATHKEAP